MPTPAPSADRQRLDQLAAIVTRNLDAFIQAGEALAAIRDEKLYRLTHPTFAEFVQASWGMSARRAYQLITAAAVAENVRTSAQIPSPDQASHLAKLPAEEQAEVWEEALIDHDQAPTVAEVAAAVDRRRPAKNKKRKPPKPIRVRVPGGIVIIEPREHDANLIQLLHDAAKQVNERKRQAA